ncbi:MAG: hypothetical protein ABSF98_19910 [Bryobacteraceae bacterium]|jgi:hypothetical protein
MNLPNPRLPRPRLPLLIGAALVAILAVYGAQRAYPPATQQVAQVGPGSPLPVYVVNEPSIPDDFVPGSTWRFTSWTVPNSMTWTARVDKVSGSWAYLTVQGNEQTTAGWYYIPQMPGYWQKQ